MRNHSAKVRSLAKDLTKEFPRSPRETLAGYVVAARALDKCRAVLNGTAGEYKFDCRLDRTFLDFAGIDAAAFKDFVATGATDSEVEEWILQHHKGHSAVEIIKWNNKMRELRISEMPDAVQEFLEGYIRQFVPAGKVVRGWFDVYDLEERRF